MAVVGGGDQLPGAWSAPPATSNAAGTACATFEQHAKPHDTAHRVNGQRFGLLDRLQLRAAAGAGGRGLFDAATAAQQDPILPHTLVFSILAQ